MTQPQPEPDPAHLSRPIVTVPVVSGPSRGLLVRVPEEPDGRPVREVTMSGVTYDLQRGPDGWEYAAPVPPQRTVSWPES
jgi:hypothetical protein